MIIGTLKIFMKVIFFIILCIAFLLLWSNLRASKAIEDGEFNEAKFCIDENHLRNKKNGKPTEKIINWVINEQFGHRYKVSSNFVRHLNSAINYITITIFWSDKKKLKLYNLAMKDAKYCSQLRHKKLNIAS